MNSNMEYSGKGKEMRELLERMEANKVLYPYDGDLSNPVDMFLKESNFTKPIVTEGLIHTYPPEKTINYISNALKIDKSFFEINVANNDVQRIFAKINLNKTPEKLVIAAFEYCGYFHALNKETNVTQDGKYYITMVFEQKNQKDDTEEILENNKTLYHISPTMFEKSIFNIGLSPKHGNYYFNFPERVYLVEEKCTDGHLFSLAWNMSRGIYNGNLKRLIDIRDKDQFSWTIYVIEVNKLQPGTKFFKDPNWEFGIFTPNNISPKAFHYYGHFDFHKYLETGNINDVNITWKN